MIACGHTFGGAASAASTLARPSPSSMGRMSHTLQMIGGAGGEANASATELTVFPSAVTRPTLTGAGRGQSVEGRSARSATGGRGERAPAHRRLADRPLHGLLLARPLRSQPGSQAQRSSPRSGRVTGHTPGSRSRRVEPAADRPRRTRPVPGQTIRALPIRPEVVIPLKRGQVGGAHQSVDVRGERFGLGFP